MSINLNEEVLILAASVSRATTEDQQTALLLRGLKAFADRVTQSVYADMSEAWSASISELHHMHSECVRCKPGKPCPQSVSLSNGFKAASDRMWKMLKEFGVE